MGKNERTITEALVTVTFRLEDLGTYGPGSLMDQARNAAADRLSVLLATDIDKAQVRVESVSYDNVGITGKFEAIRS
jgi:hypothetical protein